MKLQSICSVVFALLLVVASSAYAKQSAGVLLQSGLYQEEVKGDLDAAIKVYERIIINFPKDRPVAAKALLHIGLCYEKLGLKQAQEAFQKVVDNFPDQQEVFEVAKERLSRTVKAKAVLEGGEKEFTLREIRSGSEQGKISPDGRHLVYTDWETGDLAVLEIATGNKRCITNKGSWRESSEFALFSSWSPDGGQIGYDWYDENNNPQIRIIGLDDTEPRILWRDESQKKGTVIYYSWSPDGKYILALLFKSAEPSQIALISVSDGSERVLKDLDLRNLAVNQTINMGFSPDGRYIVYDRPADNNTPNRDIFAFSIDDKLEIPLVQHPANDTLLGWVPDGRYVLFARKMGGIDDIWILSVEAGKPKGAPRLIRKDMGEIRPQGFTRDGSFYYVTSSPGTGGVYIAKLDPETGQVITQPKELVEHLGRSTRSPAYSPDGKYLAYVSLRGPGMNGLCIRSLETGIEQLFPKLLGFSNLRWSPDGRSILAITSDSRGRQGHNLICKIDTETGNVTTVLRCEDNRMNQTINSAEWSLDGKAVFYVLNNRSERLCQLLVRDLKSGEEKELYRAPSLAERFSMSRSPDGKWLALNNYRGLEQKKIVLEVIPAAGGEPRELFSFETETNWRFNTTWTADSRFILLPKSKPGAVELWRISAQDGKAQKTGLTMSRIWNLSAHPDGQSIVLNGLQAEPESELWVMENFLPKIEPKGIILRQVWAGLDVRIGNMSSPSPDGRYISYTDRNGGDLALLELAAKKKRRLTNNLSFIESLKKRTLTEKETMSLVSSVRVASKPTWSPDGRQIVYGWCSLIGDPESEIRLIGFDGSEPRVLSSNDDFEFTVPFDWSPDGKQIIAFIGKYDLTGQAVLVSVADGSVRILKNYDRPYMQVQAKVLFSPDGRYIVYDFPQKEDSPEHDIYQMSTDGSREISLVEHPAHDFVLGWAPDGKRLLFASDRTGEISVWIIQVANGKPQGDAELIKKDIGQIYPLGFTREGSFYYALQAGMEDVYTATLDLEKSKLLTSPEKANQRLVGSTFFPDLSPDGKYLAYKSGEKLYIQSLETGMVRELTPDLKSFGPLRWSPDSHSILTPGVDHKGRNGLFEIDTKTGDITSIVQLVPDAKVRWATWSPDGKKLFYKYIGSIMDDRIVMYDPLTKQEKELPCVDSKFMALSPDGRSLAFLTQDQETLSSTRSLNIMPAAGGELREVLKFKKEEVITTVAWTPDGSRLLFAKGISNGKKCELWQISIEGGKPQKLGLAMEKLNFLSVHPDGRRIAFCSSHYSAEIWVMENFLPKSTTSK